MLVPHWERAYMRMATRSRFTMPTVQGVGRCTRRYLVAVAEIC